MSDVAPKLLENLQKSYESNLAADKKAAASLEKINAGDGNYVTAGEYAECVGSSLAKSFQTNLSSKDLPDGKMYWNIAEKTIEPLMKGEYNTVSKVAQTVQKSLNTKAGMGLNAVKASYDYDLVKGIMDKVCSYDLYDDAAWLLNDAAVSFSRAVVDQTLKANVNFQGKSGKTPKIIRRAGFKCCQWCADLEGIYEYPKVPEDVYRRHDNCRCDVEYDPGTGRVQNVHTKEWRDPEESARIEERKNIIGSNMNIDKEELKTVNNNYSKPLKMDLQFFGSNPEKDLYKQSSASLRRGIRSSEKQISIHEDKIKNPEKYFPEWNQWDSRNQQGYIKHWQKEINNFQESNERRRNELRKRGEYNE